MAKENDLEKVSAPVFQNKGRRILLILIVVSVLPVAAAYFVFYTGLGLPKGTSNRGVLLETSLSVQDIVDPATWQRIQGDKKWRLILPISGSCHDQCQQQLYTTRQVHIRLGDKSQRVGRIALNIGGQASHLLLEQLAAEHPLLHITETDRPLWKQWLEQSTTLSALEGTFYLLVDQEGWAMMVYTDQHGNELLKDLKHVLKSSIDYQ